MIDRFVPQSEDVQKLLHHIQSNPEICEKIRNIAANDDPSNAQKHIDLAVKLLLYWFNANPDDFHGTAYVTQELRDHAKLTAKVVSASGLIDFLSNWPILFFLFSTLGTPWALVISFGLNVWLLQICNYTATAASGRKLENRSWAGWATASLISLNILQTMASGVGIELLNNQTTLSQLRAAELKLEGDKRVEDLKKFTSPQLDSFRHRCETGKKELNQKMNSDSGYDALYESLYGTWAERNRNWSSVEPESRPICVQANFLEQEAFRYYEQAKADWEQLKADNILMDNLTFVKQSLPDLYAQHFTEKGLLRSGVDATRLATQNFFGKIANLQFLDLGLSLYVFGISAITSFAACTMAIAHANRPDTQMSRDENVIRERDRYLQELINITKS